MRSLLALLAAACLSLPASARQVPLPDGPVAPAVEALEAGDFLWAEEVAPEGPVTIIVSLPLQRAQVYRNGVLIGVSTVSTGKPGHETPTGVFTVLQKRVEHFSNLYNNAPMPFMQRLTWDGVALHAGTLPGHPASHGCIRLPPPFAEKLFGVTQLGITVIVTDSSELPRLMIARGGPAVLSAPGAVDGETVWRPWLQKDGPVSILVSGADHSLRVVRNGVEIGRAPVMLGREVERTELYSLGLADAANDRFQWIRIPLKEGEETGPISVAERGNLLLPPDFRAALARLIGVGTTVIVTPDSLEDAAFDDVFQILAPAEPTGGN